MTNKPPQGAPVRVGVIGLGGAGSGMTSRFARSPLFEVAAAADIDTDLMARFGADFPDVTAYTNAEGVCEQKDVDLVYVGTPNRFHVEHACMALAAGKHVLVEKPMSFNLEDADAMIDAADRAGRLLAVNVKHSFEPRIEKVAEYVRTGEFGKFRMLHNWRYADWLYRPRTQEELTPQLGGGILWRQGPHQLDIFRTIGGGLIRSIRGNVDTWDPSRRVTGAYTAYVTFENGAIGTAVYSGYDHYESRELVFGTLDDEDDWYGEARRELASHDYSVEWEEAAASAERYGGDRRAIPGGTLGHRLTATGGNAGGGWVLNGPMIASFDNADVKLSAAGLAVYGNEGRYEVPLPRADGITTRLESIYDAISNGTPLRADGRWGKATVEALIALEASSDQAAEVRLEHQVPFVL
jgi:phthalate 4,5-cis-dihydrodiol dehydrogenase